MARRRRYSDAARKAHLKAKHDAWSARKGARFVERALEARRARHESTEVEALYYRAVFDAFPERRPTPAEMHEDFQCDRQVVARNQQPSIKPGQVWRRLEETIRVVRLRTEAGGHGGHFMVLVEDLDDVGNPFEINAARIRMYWHLERECVQAGQLELFA